jgi:hypothetical protein
MFELGDVSQGGQRPDRMFVPSSCWESLDGPPLEHVMLVRDEMANLAWAIEKRVPGTSGESLDRTREDAQLAFRQQFTLEADDPLLIYRLATPVPANWIPLLPTRQGAQLADSLVIQLQRRYAAILFSGAGTIRRRSRPPAIHRQAQSARAGRRGPLHRQSR